MFNWYERLFCHYEMYIFIGLHVCVKTKIREIKRWPQHINGARIDEKYIDIDCFKGFCSKCSITFFKNCMHIKSTNIIIWKMYQKHTMCYTLISLTIKALKITKCAPLMSRITCLMYAECQNTGKPNHLNKEKKVSP